MAYGRQWMKEVLQPLNEKAADIIVRHADLLQSAQMEPLLLQLVAHVSAYRVILKRCSLPSPCGLPCWTMTRPIGLCSSCQFYQEFD